MKEDPRGKEGERRQKKEWDEEKERRTRVLSYAEKRSQWIRDEEEEEEEERTVIGDELDELSKESAQMKTGRDGGIDGVQTFNTFITSFTLCNIEQSSSLQLSTEISIQSTRFFLSFQSHEKK